MAPPTAANLRERMDLAYKAGPHRDKVLKALAAFHDQKKRREAS